MDLLIIMVIAYFLRDAVSEARWAAQGKVSPRWQAKLERLRQAGKPAVKPRYGSREWAADLWADTLQAQTARRRNRTAERKARALDAAVDEAIAVAAPSAPAIQETAKPAPVIQETAANPEPPAPAPAPDSRPDARVIPMFPTKKEEVPAMSEVSGLITAHRFAESMVAGHRENITKIESFVAYLRSRDVTGTALDDAVRAGEQNSVDLATWESVAGALSEHFAVREAYLAHAGAGDKDHLLGE